MGSEWGKEGTTTATLESWEEKKGGAPTTGGRTEDVLQRNKRFASLLFPLLPGRTNGMEPMDGWMDHGRTVEHRYFVTRTTSLPKSLYPT